MAEINLDGGPIFVDVSTGQQYPISEITQLLPAPAQPVKDEGQKAETLQEIAEALQHDTPTEVTKTTENSNVNDGTVSTTQRIRCSECHRYTAESEEKMIRHIRKVHRGENPFLCYMCDYSTYNKSLFEEHVRIHQGVKPFKCSHCPYRSASKKNTKKHELIHRPDNPLKCTECNFIARHPRALHCHKKNHSVSVKQELDNTCPSCPFSYKKDEQLRSHKKCKKKCKSCDYIACSTRLLTVHMSEVHGIRKSSKSRDTGKLFSCTLCEWSSNNKPRILLHLIHHPKQSVDESVIDVSILRQYGIME